MKTIKDILSENRDSVISSIKYMFKVYRIEEIRPIMVRFLSYAEKYGDVESLENSKRVKSDLKDILAHMFIIEKREREEAENIRLYGTRNPKLADIMGKIAEKEEENGNVWHPIYKAWVKSENAFSSMAK